MIALICFVLAVLASLFKSKSRQSGHAKHGPALMEGLGVRQDRAGPRTLGLRGPITITGTLRKWFPGCGKASDK